MSKRLDPNTMRRHFAVTMWGHPLTGERFPDPMDGDAATVRLHELVESALAELDRTLGSSLRYRVACLEQGSSPGQRGDRAPSEEKPSDESGFHLQCYVESFRSIRLRTLWRSLPMAHIRPRRRSRETARDYCLPHKGHPSGEQDPTFVAGPFIAGDWRPSRADEDHDDPLAEAIRLIATGASLRAVAFDFPRIWVRHGRGLRDLAETLRDERPF
jgi:hypothetical protein